MFTYRTPLPLLFVGVVIVNCNLNTKDSTYVLEDNFQREMKEYFKNYNNSMCPALNERTWKLFKELTTPEVFVEEEERSKLSIKDVGFVTFTSQNHTHEAL